MNLVKDAFSAAGSAIGSLALGMGKVAGKAIAEVGVGTADLAGNALIGSAKAAGKGAVKTADFVGEGVLQSLNSPRGIYNPVGTIAGLSKSAADAIIKGPLKMGRYEREKHHINRFTGKTEIDPGGLKLTPLGMGVLLGSGALAGAMSAEHQYRSNRIGPVDPQTRTATPSMAPQEYRRGIDDAGATGDLVFALHQNRRG